MKQKLVWFIIGALIIAMLAFAAGLQRGRALANQACIDKVSENCEFICGVPRDNFYYPDQQSDADPDQELDNYDESAIAMKGNLNLWN